MSGRRPADCNGSLDMTTLVLATRRLLTSEAVMLRRLAVPVALLAAGALAAAVIGSGTGSWLASIAREPAVEAALGATLITAFATGLGALPVLFMRGISGRARDGMLGFGAGVMLAASVFSLLIPALEAGAAWAGSAISGGMIVAAGVALGALFLLAADRMLPHAHTAQGPARRGIPRAWLFVFAIALHNLPEGLAVGVAQADGAANAAAVTFGIALQNLPEGLAVAAALAAIGIAPLKAFAIAFLTGLMEPLGGVIGAGAVAAAQGVLPWGLAFAAGAMMFVVAHEIIPATLRKDNARAAAAALAAGFIVMTLSDTMLG
jgi:ZIP family zinc transporter